MNLLNKTRTYLIGSIENVSNGNDWREYVTQKLNRMGVIVFNPFIRPFVGDNIKEDHNARQEMKNYMETGQYDKVAERMKHIRSDDLRLVDLSDFLFAYISPTLASWGSAEEIYLANREKKAIFIVVEGGKKKTPVWLLGMLPDKYFYDSIDDALDMISSIDAGLVRVDSQRFRLLKPEYR